uniref:Uncharacterized protein n=1 Tax=Meloidogyne enterolobii TaxID=390850 RepID=A0A6V7VE52_MELEN|nr:unnamed protein product [Meloidogyne enterolobii]
MVVLFCSFTLTLTAATLFHLIPSRNDLLFFSTQFLLDFFSFHSFLVHTFLLFCTFLFKIF